MPHVWTVFFEIFNSTLLVVCAVALFGTLARVNRAKRELTALEAQSDRSLEELRQLAAAVGAPLPPPGWMPPPGATVGSFTGHATLAVGPDGEMRVIDGGEMPAEMRATLTALLKAHRDKLN